MRTEQSADDRSTEDRSAVARANEAALEAARRHLARRHAPANRQSDFARRYVAQGNQNGRAELVLRQLTLRFGSLPVEVQSRIPAASIGELDALGVRLLTASTLREVLAPE